MMGMTMETTRMTRVKVRSWKLQMHGPPKEQEVVMIRAMHVMHAEISHVGYGGVKRRTRYRTKIGIGQNLLQSPVIAASQGRK